MAGKRKHSHSPPEDEPAKKKDHRSTIPIEDEHHENSPEEPAFYELRRHQPPKTVKRFKKLIKRLDRSRSSKATHKSTDGCSHAQIPTKIEFNVFQRGIEVVDELTFDAYDVMALASQAIDSFKTRKSMRNDQFQAALEFNQLRNEHQNPKGLLRRLGRIDPTKPGGVLPSELEHLLNIFSRIFLLGKLKCEVKWDATLTVYGECGHKPGKGAGLLVALHPHMWEDVPGAGGFNSRTMDRLGTLLHEAIHAFFEQWGCPCKSWTENLDDANGHGRAWQNLASAIERKALDYLGLPLTLSRFDALRNHWDDIKFTPSVLDLKTWKLKDDV